MHWWKYDWWVIRLFTREREYAVKSGQSALGGTELSRQEGAVSSSRFFTFLLYTDTSYTLRNRCNVFDQNFAGHF